ncbi:MAG TPA: hypothetical protein VNI57_03710 [Candidatus Saccharimonadales bacterium]|nr:hypothetical protein [Candidatus Saccharimonadales bacterium]
MSFRPHALVSTALALALAMPPIGVPTFAQDKDTPPAQEKAPEKTDAKETPPEKTEEAPQLTDRLTLRIGPAYTMLHAKSRSSSLFRDPQTGQKIALINYERFDASSGASLVADASYEVSKNWFVLASLMTTSLGTGDFTDSRLIDKPRGPGDETLVDFASTHESDQTNWSIGGARRVFPTKRYKDSKLYADAMLIIGQSETDYTFHAGEVTKDPFNAPAFNPALGFDPRGRSDASFNFKYTSLQAGVRMGGTITDKFSLEGTFLPTWFGRYRGEANLGPHGTALKHSPGITHTRSRAAIVANDLFAPVVDVTQESNRIRGLTVGLNSYFIVKDWLTVDVGFGRTFTRSIGGNEVRDYSNDAVAGCPSPGPVDPNDPNGLQLTGHCPKTSGDLVNATVVTDTFYVMGHFHLY